MEPVPLSMAVFYTRIFVLGLREDEPAGFHGSINRVRRPDVIERTGTRLSRRRPVPNAWRTAAPVIVVTSQGTPCYCSHLTDKEPEAQIIILRSYADDRTGVQIQAAWIQRDPPHHVCLD